jgi:hypothetical protein
MLTAGNAMFCGLSNDGMQATLRVANCHWSTLTARSAGSSMRLRSEATHG